jgi:hypothetical protein
MDGTDVDDRTRQRFDQRSVMPCSSTYQGVYVEAAGVSMKSSKSDLPQGTLDMLILQIIALGPIHGYAIAQRI